jgi:hypothetical protein
MEKDSFELATGRAGETGHCANTTQMGTETTLAPLRELHDGYGASRFNALRHGVLSVHTVLPWEDKAEYEALLNALVEEYAPHGPTEEHLVGKKLLASFGGNAACGLRRPRHTDAVLKRQPIFFQILSIQRSI